MYKEFIENHLGKKKNSWTFTHIEYVKIDKSTRLMVTCVCDCGTIKFYTASHCNSDMFPKSCRLCFKKRNRWPNQKYKQKNKELCIPLDDDVSIIQIYEDHYKRYYRD